MDSRYLNHLIDVVRLMRLDYIAQRAVSRKTGAGLPAR
jgi:hypothetical protein